MRKTIVVISVAVFVTLVNLAQPRCVWACDCDVVPVPDAIDDAKAVFAGEVTTITRSSGRLAVTFDVSRMWKGAVASTLTVEPGPGGSSCGYEFQQGQEYLVYIAGFDTTFAPTSPDNIVQQSGKCTRTQPLASAQADLTVLGAGQAPTTGTAETSQPPAVLPNTAGQIDVPARNLPIMLLGVTTMLAGVAARALQRRVR